MMLVWLVIVCLIIYFINNQKSSGANYDREKTPESILRERYANGEIDDETYLRMRQTLNR